MPESLMNSPEARTTLLPKWREKHPHSSAIPIVENICKDLKETEKIQKIGIQGYCYGGYLSVFFAGHPEMVDAYAAAHPSALKIPQDIEPIQIPGIWECAEIDHQLDEAGRTKVKEILDNKKSIRTEWNFYPGTSHGFAVRADPTNEIAFKAKQQALQDSVSFFKSIL